MLKLSALSAWRYSWTNWLGMTMAVTTLSITACTQSTNNTTSTSEPLVSVTSAWIGFSNYYVAAKKGLFTENKVVVKDIFAATAPKAFTAFMSGQADLAWVTTGDAVQMAEKDPTVKIIYVTDYSNGSDGIVGRNIKSPLELKGKTIARENMLYEKVFLKEYLKTAGLTAKDVKIKDMDAEAAATAFATKKVDAAVTFEPFLSKAAKTGGGKILFTTKDTNLIADVIVTRQSLLQSRKSELQAYLKAVDQAVKLTNNGDPEALKIIGTQLSISADEVKSQLQGVKLFDIEGNKKIAFNKSSPNSVMSNLDLVTKEAAEFSKPLEVNSLYDTSLVDSF